VARIVPILSWTGTAGCSAAPSGAAKISHRLKSLLARRRLDGILIFGFLVFEQPYHSCLGLRLAQQGDVEAVAVDRFDRCLIRRNKPAGRAYRREKRDQHHCRHRNTPRNSRKSDAAAHPVEDALARRFLLRDPLAHPGPERRERGVGHPRLERALKRGVETLNAHFLGGASGALLDVEFDLRASGLRQLAVEPGAEPFLNAIAIAHKSGPSFSCNYERLRSH